MWWAVPPVEASAAVRTAKKELRNFAALFFAVRTRLENQLKHPLQTLAGVLSIAYLCQ
jgi:hypothetical protein